MDLSDSWPSFFDHLDSDQQRAQREFCEWAMRFFAACPPGQLSGLPREQREPLCYDIIGDCIIDDFKILRKYKNCGKPFAGWFMVVARRRIIDRFRSIKRTPDVDRSDFAIDSTGRSKWEPVVIEYHTAKRIQKVIEQCLSHMTEQCQNLIPLVADGEKIKDILAMRVVEADTNKKMSNAIKHCQKRLRECLASRGVEISQLRGPAMKRTPGKLSGPAKKRGPTKKRRSAKNE